MADFLQSNPVVVLAILFVNAVLVAFFCYCGLRNWRGRQNRNNGIMIPVTHYIIETPITPAAETIEPELEAIPAGYHNVLVVGQGYVQNADGNTRISIAEQNETETHECHKSLLGSYSLDKDEPPPPSYYDIFPEEKDQA